MPRRTLTLSAAMVLATVLGAAAPASAGATGSASTPGFTAGGCTATISDITRVTVDGAAVVRFTGQVQCGVPGTQILLHTNLFNCGDLQPKARKPWLLANCGNLTSAETFTPEGTGVTYTISSADYPASDAYYAPVLSFNLDGTTPSGPDFGTPVLCGTDSCANTTYLV